MTKYIDNDLNIAIQRYKREDNGSYSLDAARLISKARRVVQDIELEQQYINSLVRGGYDVDFSIYDPYGLQEMHDVISGDDD